MGVFLACGALFAFGVQSTVERWVSKNWVSERAELIAEIFAKIMVAGLGWIVGCRSWDPIYGAVTGTIGAWSSPWVMEWLNKIVVMMLRKENKSEDESS